MLVLSRCVNESIELTTASGERITVMVVQIRGDKVRIGIEADRSVTIWRGEIAERMAKEKRAA